ncbi:VanZ family protein [Ekhidna sp.]|uniref:VanZ family protein n=1 Tax=Ekhidna sp. TaxID=2608089 RepID=UPI003B511ADA
MNLNNKNIWFVPAIVVAVGIFLLSTFLSFPVQVKEISYFDKIEHCFAYFVLILSFLIAYKKAGKLTNRRLYLLVLFACLYGLLLEAVQFSLFPNRFFEWVDAAANVLGVLIGFAIFKILKIG